MTTTVTRKITKTWIRIGNTFHLFANIGLRTTKVSYKKFRVLYEDANVIELNKKLKEFDLIERIFKTTGERVELV